MFNQHRIYRVFQLLNYLKARPPKTHASLARLLEVSERSIYRYLDLLSELGFHIEKTNHGALYLENDEAELASFTPQEKEHIAKSLLITGNHDPLSQSIVAKIKSESGIGSAAGIVFQTHLSSIIEKIADAIVQRRQIKLKRYYSGNSQTISDRLVEPVQFTDNYESISAYEVVTGQNKYFNIQRISDVEITPQPIAHSKRHQYYKPDLFGFQGREMNCIVEMELSLRAALLLKEEYPLARAFIRPIPDTPEKYHFKTFVQSYQPPTRFARGLPDDVSVIGDEGFLEALSIGKKRP